MHVIPIPSNFPTCLNLPFISISNHIPISRARAALYLISLGVWLFLALSFGERFQVERLSGENLQIEESQLLTQ